MILTSQDIVDGLSDCKTIEAWANDIGLSTRYLRKLIVDWRAGTPRRVRAEVAQELVALGVTRASAARVTGIYDVDDPGVPSAEDLEADAAHIAQWGHV